MNDSINVPLLVLLYYSSIHGSTIQYTQLIKRLEAVDLKALFLHYYYSVHSVIIKAERSDSWIMRQLWYYQMIMEPYFRIHGFIAFWVDHVLLVFLNMLEQKSLIRWTSFGLLTNTGPSSTHLFLVHKIGRAVLNLLGPLSSHSANCSHIWNAFCQAGPNRNGLSEPKVFRLSARN